MAGFEAAVFPKQDHLLEISKIRKSPNSVCQSAGPSGTTLASASYWGKATSEPWFDTLGLPAGSASVGGAGSDRVHVVSTEEVVQSLDVGSLPGMDGPTFSGGAATSPAAPLAAVFVDDVADPIEIFTIVSRLMEENIGFHLISHSLGGAPATRRVTSETVF